MAYQSEDFETVINHKLRTKEKTLERAGKVKRRSEVQAENFLFLSEVVKDVGGDADGGDDGPHD